MWAKQYQKVTSASELVNGAKYLIITSEAYSNASDPVVTSQYVTIGEVASNNRKGAVVSISGDIATANIATASGSPDAHEVMLIASGDNWNLYDVANAMYLNGGSTKKSGNNNYLKTAASVETATGQSKNNGVWTITISEGKADIKNANNFHLRFNPNLQGSVGSKTYNPIMATYNNDSYNTYNDVSLYKEIAEPAAPTSSTTWDFSSPFIGKVTASTTNTLKATDGATEMTYVAGSSDQINSAGYLKPNGASTKSGGSLTSRYLIMHIVNSGTLTLTSNSTKPGEYLIYQGTSEDITAATAQTSITTSSTDLTASEDYDIANGEYLFIGFNAQIYTEKVVWAVPNKVTLTTSDNMDGWRSFYDATQDYEVDANTKIYVAAKSSEENSVTLTPLDVTKIPHGEAVILKTSAADHKMTLTKTTGAATLGNNVLTVTNGTSNVDGYRLGYKDGTGVAFFKYTTTTAPAADIVYIDKANVNTGATAPEFLTIGGETTGISTTLNNIEESNKEIFNLNGQRVAQPTKGLYIVNGRKVIIK